MLVPLALTVASLVPDDGGSYAALSSLAIARQEVGAARIDGDVYVVGGLVQGFNTTATVEVYDVANDSWSFGPSIPAPRHHAAVAAHDSRLFVIGGYPGGFTPVDTVFVLDTATGVWSNAADLPERVAAGWAVTIGDAIYHVGGETPSGASPRTYRYDVALDTWTRVADMPTAREHLNAAALDGLVHVVGGRDGGSTSAHERYDPATDSWTVLAPMPTARSAAATAAFDGRLFVMGGEIPMLFSVHEVYDPLTDRWEPQASMPVPRHGIAAVSLDDRILLPAGGIVQGLGPSAVCDSFVPDGHARAVPFCFCDVGAPCGNVAAEAGCANGVGAGARLETCGSASVALDDLVFEAGPVQPGAFGLLFMGSGTTSVALGDGLRCVDPGASGLYRFPVVTANAAGVFAQGPGNVALTRAANPPAGAIVSGTTWRFQLWYRDAGPCATGSNLSSALSVTFVD